jgi:Phospholipase_D-nuclease N-terminal
MLAATSYPLLEVFWTMLIFFAFVVWIWILFTVIADLFRRDDISGWGKAGWLVFVIVLPYLGVFVYLIAEHRGMTERALARQQAMQTEMENYVRSVASDGDAAAQIAKAKTLLDEGTISEAEFDRIKTKALAA